MHHMFRTRFKREILAEFLPPSRPRKKARVILLCDGMPSIPHKQPLAEFLSRQGYWVFYPRYRGAWESGGVFMQKSPHQDILDVLDELPKGVRDIAFGQRFSLSPEEVFVIGGSFGGPAAILCSLDPRVKRVIANCPVVDWSILKNSEKAETSNPSYAAYIREAFGNGYRLSAKNWNKLRTGRFYNPIHHRTDRPDEGHDVSRQGRSLYSMENSGAVRGKHRGTAQAAQAGRPSPDQPYRPPLLAAD